MLLATALRQRDQNYRQVRPMFERQYPPRPSQICFGGACATRENHVDCAHFISAIHTQGADGRAFCPRVTRQPEREATGKRARTTAHGRASEF